MAQIKIDSDNKVIAIYYLNDEKEGWIQIDSIPEPEQIEGKVPVMYYRNGAIEYEYEDVPPTPEPEPIPEPEPTPDSTLDPIALFATMAVNSVELSDKQSLKIKSIYPEWEELIGSDLKAGFKLQYHGILYKTRQEIKPVLEIYPPSVDTASLYEEINETHEGTKEDPIPYNNNMELILGEYYSQGGIVYLCIRSTGQAVYHNLSDLVSAGYVKVAE